VSHPIKETIIDSEPYRKETHPLQRAIKYRKPLYLAEPRMSETPSEKASQIDKKPIKTSEPHTRANHGI
jgi:hypothetical protein